MGKSGKQGDSLKLDANGQLSRDDLKAMYAHWLVVRNEKGDLPAGANVVMVLVGANMKFQFTELIFTV